MVVQKGFAFPDQPPKPSSGDGASVESQYDPNTGQRNPSYRAPKPSDRLPTSGGLDSEISRQRGHEAQYRLAQSQSTGIHSYGSEGFGLQGDDTNMEQVGSIPADSNEQITSTTGGGDELVQRGEVPKDSNLQAGGRPVA
jgi:hypothetical protein